MASHAKLEGPEDACSFPSCLDVCKGQSQNHMLFATPFEQKESIFSRPERLSRGWPAWRRERLATIAEWVESLEA